MLHENELKENNFQKDYALNKKATKPKKYFSNATEREIAKLYQDSLSNENLGDILLCTNCVVRRNVAGEQFVKTDDEDTHKPLFDNIANAISVVLDGVYRKTPFDVKDLYSTNIMITSTSPYIAALLDEPVSNKYSAYLADERSRIFCSYMDLYSEDSSRYTLLGYDNHITHVTTADTVVNAFTTALEDLEYIKQIANIEYAGHPRFGYLTTKPEHCGSGITIATLLALPALAIRGGLEAVLNGVQRLEYDVVPAIEELSELDGGLAEKQRSPLFGKAAPGALYYITASVPQEGYEEFLKQYTETVCTVVTAETEERVKLTCANNNLMRVDDDINVLFDIYSEGAATISASAMNGHLANGANMFAMSHNCFFDNLSLICMDKVYFFNNGPVEEDMEMISPYAHYQNHLVNSLWFSERVSVDLMQRHCSYARLINELSRCKCFAEMVLNPFRAGKLESHESVAECIEKQQAKKKKTATAKKSTKKKPTAKKKSVKEK